MVDFHTHVSESGVLSLTPGEYIRHPHDSRRMLTVGIHPWMTDKVSAMDMDILQTAISDPRVAAVGEIGVDPLRGASVDRQVELLRWQLDLAAMASLPVVLHVVRRYDLILRLWKEYRGMSKWAVHGFRGKPSVAASLCSGGIYVSFGDKFNACSVTEVPDSLLLTETDDAATDIEAVIRSVADCRDVEPSFVRRIVEENIAGFYRHQALV